MFTKIAEGIRTAIGSALGIILCLSISAFFAYAFYLRYWKWRDCIAVVESSCTLPGAGNATDGGRIWAIPALIFFGMAIVRCVRFLRARKGLPSAAGPTNTEPR